MNTLETVKSNSLNIDGNSMMKKDTAFNSRLGAFAQDQGRMSAPAIEYSAARPHNAEAHEIADVSGTLGQASIPPCPPEYAKFVEETSLEKLVFWKLEKLVENLSTDYLGSVELNVLDKVVTHVEKPLFALVLRKTSGNLSIAAKLLGCNRNTLHRKLREFEIIPKDLRKMLRRGRIQKLTQMP
jgi:DNA-binding protein Fis